MRLEDFVREEIVRARGFEAWWRTCHRFAVNCEEEGESADVLWPLDHGAGEYGEAIHFFEGSEIAGMPEEQFEHAMSLLPEEDRAFWVGLRAGPGPQAA